MPISAPSLGGDEDDRDPRYQADDMYEVDQLEFSGLTPPTAELLLKQLGAGVTEKHQEVEGVGWKARIEETAEGVIVHFRAHDELIDDLLRRFERLAQREMG